MVASKQREVEFMQKKSNRSLSCLDLGTNLMHLLEGIRPHARPSSNGSMPRLISSLVDCKRGLVCRLVRCRVVMLGSTREVEALKGLSCLQHVQRRCSPHRLQQMLHPDEQEHCPMRRGLGSSTTGSLSRSCSICECSLLERWCSGTQRRSSACCEATYHPSDR